MSAKTKTPDQAPPAAPQPDPDAAHSVAELEARGPAVVETQNAPKDESAGKWLQVAPGRQDDAVDLSSYIDGGLVLRRGKTARVSAKDADTLLALRDAGGVPFVAEAADED